jgi:hypothetical protein
MNDREIAHGTVSFLRKPRKRVFQPRAAGDFKQTGVKSFTLTRRSVSRRRPDTSKTFSKGLVKSLVRKK